MIGNVYANAGLRLSGCQYYCNLRRVESSNKVVDENLLTDSRNTQYRCCRIEQEVVSESLKLSASIHIVANGCIFGGVGVSHGNGRIYLEEPISCRKVK
jgi:hypothetical protein